MHIIRILFLGDVVGERSVEAISKKLPGILRIWKIDFTVINGENMHKGRGFNEVLCRKLFKAGANVLTGGDHSFDKHLIFPYFNKETRVLRPANYPNSSPGRGFYTYSEVIREKEVKITVINLRGEAFFHNPLFSPFLSIEKILSQTQEESDIILVDFHAEATAEKIFMGRYLEGRVSAVLGTHTHIQTSDAKILKRHTAYITDVGACAPIDSVIGTKQEVVARRALKRMPAKNEVADGDISLEGVVMDIDADSGKSLFIHPVKIVVSDVESA